MCSIAGLGLTLAALAIMTAAMDLQIIPPDLTIQSPHDSIVLTCVAQGPIGNQQIEANLRWYNNKDEEIIDTKGRMYLYRTGPQTLKLYIEWIENSDTGTYTCRGDHSEQTVELNIFQDITFDHAPSPQSLAIYTDALIECKVSGQPVPTLSWRCNGNAITTGGRYIQEPDGLRIINITEADGVFRYQCRGEVEAEGRFDHRTINVRVNTPPTITKAVGTQEVMDGQDVSLSCSADGYPSPLYQFFKDDNEHAMHDMHDRIVVDRHEGTIHFRPFIRADEGQYRCEAHNDVGSASDTGYLHVLSVPSALVLKPLPAESPYEYNLQWEALHTRGLPIAGYEFKIREVALTADGMVDKPLDYFVRYLRNNDPEDPMMSFTFKNLSPGTDYQIKTSARNDIGWSEFNSEFVIKTLENPL